MLPARPAKTHQGVRGDVVAPLYRNFLNGVGHVFYSNRKKPFGNGFWGLPDPRSSRNSVGQNIKLLTHRRGIERLVTLGAKNLWEKLWAQTTQQHVGIGDSQRPAVAVTSRARVGTRRIGAHPQTRPIKMQNRPATRGHRMNVNHGSPHPHPRHLRFMSALKLTCVMRHVGGSTAHVETDQSIKTRCLSGTHHAHHATRRPRKQSIFALKMVSIGQATVGLHKHEPRPLPIGTQLAIYLVYVTSQNRGQVSINHRGVAPRYQFHEGANFVAHRDLRKSDFSSQSSKRRFVFGVAITVEQSNSHRIKTISFCFLQGCTRCF